MSVPKERALPLLAITLLGIALVVVASLLDTNTSAAAVTNPSLFYQPHIKPFQNYTSIRPDSDGPPAWGKQPQQIAGRILHWSEYIYQYVDHSPDPANGKLVHGDMWAQIGTDGVPIVYHARFTLADGTFLQELVQTRNQVRVVFGPLYHNAAVSCINHSEPMSTGRMLSVLPLFTDAQTLLAASFQQNGKVISHQIPATNALPGIQPLTVYAPDSSAQHWQRSQTSGGYTDVLQLDVGTHGFVTFQHTQLVSTQGALQSESWYAYGSFQIYAAGTIPLPVLSMSTSLNLGGCNA